MTFGPFRGARPGTTAEVGGGWVGRIAQVGSVMAWPRGFLPARPCGYVVVGLLGLRAGSSHSMTSWRLSWSG